MTTKSTPVTSVVSGVSDTNYYTLISSDTLNAVFKTKRFIKPVYILKHAGTNNDFAISSLYALESQLQALYLSFKPKSTEYYMLGIILELCTRVLKKIGEPKKFNIIGTVIEFYDILELQKKINLNEYYLINSLGICYYNSVFNAIRFGYTHDLEYMLKKLKRVVNSPLNTMKVVYQHLFYIFNTSKQINYCIARIMENSMYITFRSLCYFYNNTKLLHNKFDLKINMSYTIETIIMFSQLYSDICYKKISNGCKVYIKLNPHKKLIPSFVCNKRNFILYAVLDTTKTHIYCLCTNNTTAPFKFTSYDDLRGTRKELIIIDELPKSIYACFYINI